MKHITTLVFLTSSFITLHSYADAGNQPSQSYSLSNELTNVSNEKDSYFYLKLGLGASVYKSQKDVSNTFSTQEIDFEKGFGLYTTLGTQLGKHAAIEFELSRQRSNFTGIGANGTKFTVANTDYKTAMLNFILRPDIPNASDNLNPYIGAGIGVSRVTYTVPASPLSKKSDTVQARQFILGNRFDLRDDFFIDTEYRYFKTKNPKVNAENGFPFEFDNSASQSLVFSYGKKF